MSDIAQHDLGVARHFELKFSQIPCLYLFLLTMLKALNREQGTVD